MRSAAELASWHGDFARATELAERAVVLAAAAGDLQTQMLAQMSLGWGALFDPARAVTQFEAAVALARSLEDDRGLEASLGGMAVALMALGELDRAQAVSEEGIAITIRMGDEYNRAFAEAGLAMIAAKRGQFATAIRGFQVALGRARGAAADLAISFALEGIAVVAVEHGEARLATTLAAAAEQIRAQSGGGWGMPIMGEEPPLQRAQRALPEADFSAAVAAGQALSQDEVGALALAYHPGLDDRSVDA
jgi:tetratricopeptide (TPR) repeat protein